MRIEWELAFFFYIYTYGFRGWYIDSNNSEYDMRDLFSEVSAICLLVLKPRSLEFISEISHRCAV